jgi:hypothetical protein
MFYRELGHHRHTLRARVRYLTMMPSYLGPSQGVCMGFASSRGE